MIEELGHTVLEAGSAVDALVALEQVPVDVLLTDVGLPRCPVLSLRGRCGIVGRQVRLLGA